MRLNLVGEKYGRLTILEFSHVDKNLSYWKCLCECGKTKTIGSHLFRRKTGPVRSCGCLIRETLIKRNTTILQKHGQAKHGTKKTPEYKLWDGMKQRCYNPNNKWYKRYGARGIGVYEPWRNDFLAFYDYIVKNIGLRPSKEYSLDRINNNKNYEPGNIKWATQHEQVNNRYDNVIITYNGETKPLGIWAKGAGLKAYQLYNRYVNHGWSIERALTEPLRSY